VITELNIDTHMKCKLIIDYKDADDVSVEFSHSLGRLRAFMRIQLNGSHLEAVDN
jgi:hypothetical protein